MTHYLSNLPKTNPDQVTSSEPTLIQQFEHYIKGLLTDSQLNTPTLFNKDILWVVESEHLMATKKQLPNQGALLVSIDTLDSQSLNQHYELICFWLPNLKASQFKTYLPIIIRSRDMFAHYTVVVLEPSLDLRPYGFTHLPATPFITHETDPVSNPPVQAWQFNLYDYKPRPNWLNANYWANPENWDKFRW